MNIIKKIERYQKMDCLIREKCTGPPDVFAIRLKVNRSHLYRLLDQLKDYGAPVKYNRKTLSFYYHQPFNLYRIPPFDKLSINDLEVVRGGRSTFSSVSFYEAEGLYL